MKKLSATDFCKAYEASQAHATLLDVRNPDETSAGACRDATLIPLPELERRASELLKKSVFVYCKAGGRAQKAAELLEQKGFDVTCAVECGFEQLKGKLPCR